MSDEAAERSTSRHALPTGSRPLPFRMIMVCAIVVSAVAAGGLLALFVPAGDPDQRSTVNGQWGIPLPSVAAPTQAPPTSVTPGPPSEAPATTKPSPPPTRYRPVTTAPSPTVVPPALTVGATVGLEVAGRPGLRVRHRDVVARVDRLSAASSAPDRAESRFIVRRGLAFPDCVSFEAASRPGHYLRRFFSDLLLHERSDSTVYQQEVTFCPIPTRDDKALTLLVLFPAGFTVAAAPDGRLRLDRPDQTIATRFVVRKPL